MTIEQTLVLVKPDALQKGLEFEILKRISNAGFTFPLMYKVNASETLLREHYANMLERMEKKGEPEKGEYTIRSMMDGPLIAAIAEGKNAAAAIREIGGSHFDPPRCEPGTIRRDFSEDNIQKADNEKRGIHNIIHTSDSKETANRELGLWFGKYLPQYLKFDQKDSAIYSCIAEAIGYPYPDLIRSTAGVSNEKRMLYHGIKTQEGSAGALAEGVKPMSPELGKCSFWAAGKSLFLPLEDSVFFNYSGGYNRKGLMECNIAVTNFDMLRSMCIQAPEFKDNSQFIFTETIPSEAFALLKVKIAHIKDDSHPKLRKERQEIEKVLLRAIDYQIFEKFTPNQAITYEKDGHWNKT
jgi:nucleoside-diphosphate kinase